jgi:methionine synthase II (cobalamin-independent)
MSIRTTHVGSLPRPEALTQLMYAHHAAEMKVAALVAV